MSSVWHPDKSEKILKKLSKISYQAHNIIIKNHSNLKIFDWDKDSPNHGEMRHFCAHVRDIFFFLIFSLPNKF